MATAGAKSLHQSKAAPERRPPHKGWKYMTDIKAAADTPIKLASIEQMTSDEIDAMLIAIRERRLKPVRDYEEMLNMKAAAKKEMLQKQYDRHMSMFKKELERVDKALDKIDQRAIQLRALRMQIEE